ncbi:MAG: helix-turn-helix domain-containing protein [Gemmatimonadaceae bacterium]|nr:helix-turn-helix domain-containing protein [Gemmatimonadaceae bacterium]
MNTIRPRDIPVLLYLAEHPTAAFAQIAESLGISTSTAHSARRRLVDCGLLHRIGRNGVGIARGPMLEFLQFAVPYIAPARLIARARGIPTGLAAPVVQAFASIAEIDDLVLTDAPPQVWPSHLAGAVLGTGIEPLIPAAPSIAAMDPSLYRWLALLDVLRSGDVRARAFARRALAHLVAELPT